MTEPLNRGFISLREARRTRKRQIGLKDPTAVEALHHLAVEEEALEGSDAILKAYEQRRLKKLRSWCRRQARQHRRQVAIREASAALMT